MLASPIRRDEAICAYARRWPDALSWSGQFPTFDCRRALGLINDGEYANPFFGGSRPSCSELDARFGGIRVISGIDLNAYFAHVDLRGHYGSVQPIEYLKLSTNSALTLLEQLSPTACQSVVDWTGQIVWLDFSHTSNYTKLTSSTFPALPHCTFVTSKALRHIPPSNIQDSDSLYCLAENLFHESLHQSLSAWLTVGDALDAAYDTRTSAKIEVPWRGQFWEPDRVIHAAFVYAGLIPLRMAAAEEHQIDSTTTTEAIMAFNYLQGQLPNCRAVLRAEHQPFLDQISTIRF